MTEINQNALPAVQIAPTTGELSPFISPESTLAAGHKAAVSLKRMIDDTNSKVRIGQNDHIKVEAWQTVGSFFHVTTKTNSEPCEIEGIKGAKGIAVLVDDLTGNIVGGAEAYCMRDEEGRQKMAWFKIASMAQTRAASKALANKFKWITVMAGYSPTPAEEMDGHDIHHAPKAPVVSSPDDKVTFQVAQMITDLTEMLSKMNSGDEELMAVQFKDLSKWVDKKSGDVKWLTLNDLPNISKHKPLWLVQIHKKVKEEYEKVFDGQGNPK